MNYQTGVVVIECNQSNPNGSPDFGGVPRTVDEYGVISPQSIKRKVREIVLDKSSSFWAYLKDKYGLDDDHYGIAETKDGVVNFNKSTDDESFLRSNFDARVFGTTMLTKVTTKGKSERSFKTTGCVSVSPAKSISPVSLHEQSVTSVKVTSEDKDANIGPMAWKFVDHAIYVCYVNVCAATMHKTGASETDINVFWECLKYAYVLNRSFCRSNVEIVDLFVVDHKSPMGSVPNHLIYAALTPSRISDPDLPSKSRADYHFDTKLPENIMSRVSGFRDLVMEDMQ